MRIAVCDDDPFELQRIKGTIERFIAQKQPEAAITLDAFPSADTLLLSIEKQGGFDLMILDILMPGMSGIELAKEIRVSGENCKIIFLTSTPEFAVDSYKVNAYYYLLKPWSEADLYSLIGRALLDQTNEIGSSVLVKSRGKLTRLMLNAIRYIESDNHTVRFFLRNGGDVDCFGSLADFHDSLLSDKRFVNCHKSYIVNMDFVSGISGKEFVVAGNARIPISRNAYVKTKNTYFDYFFEKGNGRRS